MKPNPLPKPFQNHPPKPPKSQKIVQEVPKRPKRCPRDVQERSRGAQGASKRRPRASRWRPRASQTLPKWSPGGYVFVFLSIFWAFICHLRSKSRFEAFFKELSSNFAAFGKVWGRFCGVVFRIFSYVHRKWRF